MKKLLLTVVIIGCAALGAWQPKIIDLSWSNPTISFLQQHLAEMEKSSPLNGITIRVRGEQIERKGKKYFAGESLWTDSKIEFKHFEKDIAALKKMPFKKFTIWTGSMMLNGNRPPPTSALPPKSAAPQV